jgi:hypothetical protein
MMNLVCIQTADGVQRIRHVDAEELVNGGHAIYVPKHVWRANTNHKQRVRNAAIHSFRTKKGMGRGQKASRANAGRFPTAH